MSAAILSAATRACSNDAIKPATGLQPLFQQRLNGFVTAMRNEKPDRIPIRPFASRSDLPWQPILSATIWPESSAGE